LRGQFAVSDTRNAFHGSGSEEEARVEISVLKMV
jgi:nucleoside diphosphate kinase